jgi:flagellar hook-associated protein 3 FlgL
MAAARRLLVPSDDPLAAGAALRARSEVRAVEASLRAVDQARSFLEVQEAQLASLQEVFSQIESLALRGSQDGYGASFRRALAAELDAYVEELVDLSAGRWKDAYLLSGSDSQTPPFEVRRDEAGRIVEVLPRAHPSTPRAFFIGGEEPLTFGVTAADVWGDSGEAFRDLLALRDRLEANDGQGVRDLLEALERHAERLQTQRAVIGIQVHRLDQTAGHLEQRRVEAEAERSRNEDLDMTAAAVALNEEMAALQAAYAAASKGLGLSLLDFLG